MLEKYREELKGEQRPVVEFENDMNIRLQREKQETAKSKLRDLRLVDDCINLALLVGSISIQRQADRAFKYCVLFHNKP